MKGEGGGKGGAAPQRGLGWGGAARGRFGAFGGLFGAFLGQQSSAAAMGATQTQIGMLWIQNSPKRAQFGPF